MQSCPPCDSPSSHTFWSANPQVRTDNAFIFGLEDTSPDKSLQILYGYVDGEKSPLIIEPRVLQSSTGELLVDLWRSGVDGHLDEFAYGCFRLTARDPYGPTALVIHVNTVTRSFEIEGESGQRRPLPTLRAIVRSKISAAQAARAAELSENSNHTEPSLWNRLRGCLRPRSS